MDANNSTIVLNRKKVLLITSICLIAILHVYIFFRFLSVPKESLKSGISECENLETPTARNFCYTELALKRNDASICDKILSVDISNYCMAGVTKNSSLCANIRDESLKQNCPPKFW